MRCSESYELVDKVIEQVGPNIRMALPLGAGKPNHIVNAFYERARSGKIQQLTIYTALSINRPKAGSFLEKRFMDPFLDRIFQGYPDLKYKVDQKSNSLPSNVKVVEFYFAAGKSLNSPLAQQNYVSSNYTHVFRDLVSEKVNVLAQLAVKGEDASKLSVSCNPDISLDLQAHLKEQKEYPFAVVGQINSDLPYMYGDAEVEAGYFDYILEGEGYDFKVVSPPKLSVSDADYMIGLYSSTLVKDNGELQIGIGSLGDALVTWLLLRQKENALYNEILNNLGVISKFNGLIQKKGSLAPFIEGLFGATEMFVDSMMFLFDAGILKKIVYDHVVLQRLLNEGKITKKITPETLFLLIKRGAIEPQLSKKDFIFLQKFGVLKQNLQFKEGYIVFPNGNKVEADFNKEKETEEILAHGLGDVLTSGAVVHAGFFLGPRAFYDWLKALPKEQRQLIHMKSVREINHLYGHEELDRLHRKNARFINTCMMMTLSGSAVSDGLESGQVVSGVGGQYNFVAMAHELPEGLSVLQLRSTRVTRGQIKSNIVYNYGHITIPRHLKDIVVTEYGIADLRSKTDAEVIKELIQIADSRFQDQLIAEAKRNGKLAQDFKLQEQFKNNTPQAYMTKIKEYKPKGYFNPFPLGCDFTETEIIVGRALKWLKSISSSKIKLVKALLIGLTLKDDLFLTQLDRMNLRSVKKIKHKIYKALLKFALKITK